MTNSEKIITVQAFVQNDEKATDGLVTVYLSQAESDILRRLYRVYGAVPEGATIPPMYEMLQCDLAARRFLRRGAQSEISHGENGVNRSYGSVNDEDLLTEVIPFAKVVG